MPHVPGTQSAIEQRKTDHIELCTRDDVEYRLTSTLLADITLIHQSLPELDFDDIDMSCEFMGKRLKAPLLISGMTGGTDEAREINRMLASVADSRGLAFGLGSQRAMLLKPELTATYAVRDVAPTAVLLANVGAVQAAESTTEAIQAMVDAVSADALCVHMNPAQELIQAQGDRSFRGCREAIARLAAGLTVPVIGKETGCGLSPRTARKLVMGGLSWCDVSGAGGTTWVGVEALRAKPGRRQIGEDFWEWGIPTAAGIVFANAAGLNAIASGGIRTGLDVARAVALGASLCGLALPFIRAVHEGGEDAVHRVVDRLIDGLQVAMLLTESANLGELRETPRLIGPELNRWLALNG